jgi:hypothetical protein
MRKTFPGYYRPSKKEFSALWSSCIFILDSNVLLNLYRYSKGTCDALICILKQVSSRLWIPHQAALEYQQQRLKVITQQLVAYDEMQDLLDKTEKQLENKLQSLRRHPYLDADGLTKRIKKPFDAIKKDLTKLKRDHPDLFECDNIRDNLSNLLEDKVGSPYSKERLNEIYRIGKERYEKSIPPGYEDTNKDGERKYGDLLLWFQVIDKAKETKKPIIIVTDDVKEDWWLRFNGRTIGPRPELIDEMLSEAGVSFYLYQADQFMDHAQKTLEKQVEQKAINEVRDIRRKDEANIYNMQKSNIYTQNLYETLKSLQGNTISHFTNDILNAQGKTTSKLMDEMLNATRGIATFPKEKLEAMQGITSFQLSEELMKSMQRMQETIATIRIQDETIKRMQEIASIVPSQNQDSRYPKSSNDSSVSEPEEMDTKDNTNK